MSTFLISKLLDSSPEETKAIYEQLYKQNIFKGKDEEDLTLVWSSGSVDMVKKILPFVKDVNELDRNGYAPIHYLIDLESHPEGISKVREMEYEYDPVGVIKLFLAIPEVDVNLSNVEGDVPLTSAYGLDPYNVTEAHYLLLDHPDIDPTAEGAYGTNYFDEFFSSAYDFKRTHDLALKILSNPRTNINTRCRRGHKDDNPGISLYNLCLMENYRELFEVVRQRDDIIVKDEFEKMQDFLDDRMESCWDYSNVFMKSHLKFLLGDITEDELLTWDNLGFRIKDLEMYDRIRDECYEVYKRFISKERKGRRKISFTVASDIEDPSVILEDLSLSSTSDGWTVVE